MQPDLIKYKSCPNFQSEFQTFLSSLLFREPGGGSGGSKWNWEEPASEFSRFIDFILDTQVSVLENGISTAHETSFLEMRYYCPSNSSDILKRSRKATSRRDSCGSNFPELSLNKKLSHFSATSQEFEPLEMNLTRCFSNGQANSGQEDLPQRFSHFVDSLSSQSLVITDFVRLFEEILIQYLRFVLLLIQCQKNPISQLSAYNHLVVSSSSSGRSFTSLPSNSTPNSLKSPNQSTKPWLSCYRNSRTSQTSAFGD